MVFLGEKDPENGWKYLGEEVLEYSEWDLRSFKLPTILGNGIVTSSSAFPHFAMYGNFVSRNVTSRETTIFLFSK